MKKISLLIVISLISFTFISCKDNSNKKKIEDSLAKKYAKYEINVFNNIELKKRATTLSKAESVDLLAETESQDKKTKISKIKLTDDTVAFVNSKHLADRPLVFLKETKAYLRNNITSRVYTTIPRGTIAFTISEKGEWIQIYAGKIKSKRVTRQWVKDGYSSDANLVIAARTYEEAVKIIDNSDEKSDQKKIEEAKKTLIELSSSANVIADMAKERINIPETAVEKTENKETEIKTDSNSENESASNKDSNKPE